MNSIKAYHAREERIAADEETMSDAAYTQISEQFVQTYERVSRLTETHVRYATKERSTRPARYKNAYNPLASALADVFGVEEAYS